MYVKCHKRPAAVQHSIRGSTLNHYTSVINDGGFFSFSLELVLCTLAALKEKENYINKTTTFREHKLDIF